jgi:sugar-specific transcriptional regulator TrmB
MSTLLLEQVGLTPDQAKIYTALISTGTISARKISINSDVNRSLVYKILKQLVDFGLVVENIIPSAVSTFTALHPSKLYSFIKKKEDDYKLADAALTEAVSILGAQFNLTAGRPTVRSFEGLEGVGILNKDILQTKSDIKLIRSPLDNNTDELKVLTSQNRDKMRDAGIKIKLIVPIKNQPSSISKEEDERYLLERRRIPREDLNNPAQVVVYGNKVAFTTFGDYSITTIVEDESIAKTFNMLFDVLWNKYPASN